jgi:cytochrome bd ubiquinol oxidase subunit II
MVFTMHGSVYLAEKTVGELQDRCRNWASYLWMVFVVFYIILTIWTWIALPYLFQTSLSNPVFYIFLTILVASIVSLPVPLKAGKFNRAFLFSSLIIAMMLGQMSLSLYPRLVPSSRSLLHSLTIYNASSSPLTLQTMLVIALIGVPIVIAYSILIHHVFRGKVELTKESY